MNPEIERKESGLSSTELAKERTDLAQHRTDLSEYRSDLSSMRSHLANERTHLAYLRTGISLVSLGITMNRFSWFLIENKSISRYGGSSFLHDAKNVGLGMVILGSAMLAWSLARYYKAARSIETLDYKPSHTAVLAFTLSIILIGIVSIVWLMTS